MQKTALKAAYQYKVDRVKLADGLSTTVRVLKYDIGNVRPELVCFDAPTRLIDWCQENNIDSVINGGFFVSESGEQLGELWLEGKKKAHSSSQYDRGCLYIGKKLTIIDKRSYLQPIPAGSLLEAGPLLIKEGTSLVHVDDPEGFSSESTQFDSDITVERHPRSAIATNSSQLWAVVCEGRAGDEAGMTLSELADYLISIGATDALNLDGGSSAGLVIDGKLVNQPRTDEKLLPRGRAIKTAIAFKLE